VKNTTNRYGWFDVDHDEQKASSLFRVGFFGDSYAESVMVPSERHFFRNLPSQISGIPMEYFGFGMSGYGTVHSYLNSKKWIGMYDLDLIIYVFHNNDIGDNISWIKKRKNRPYAVKISSEPGFTIEWDSHDPPKSKPTFLQDIQYVVNARSMFFRVINYRMALLEKLSSKHQDNEKDMGVKTLKVPNQNDLPSTWPEEIRIHAQGVAFSVLKLWSQEVKAGGKQFAVFYVPKGFETSEDSPKRDSFKEWLVNFCERLGIPLLDPSRALLTARTQGIAVYRDHWTSAGHAVVSGFLIEKLGDIFSQVRNELTLDRGDHRGQYVVPN